MKNFIKKTIGSYVTFLPLIVFMAMYKIYSNWHTAFIFGGAVSCLYLLFVFYEHIKNDLFMMGVNCFLIGGATMCVFKLYWLGSIYKYFGYSTVLIWIFIVGLIATLFSSDGFIAVKHQNKKLVKLFSTYLLSGVLISIAFSLYFAKQIFMIAPIPFIFLFILRELLVTKLKSI